MSFARRAGHNSALGARTHLRTGEDFMAESRASPVSASPAQGAEGKRRQRFTANRLGDKRCFAPPAPRILTIAQNRLTEGFRHSTYLTSFIHLRKAWPTARPGVVGDPWL